MPKFVTQGTSTTTGGVVLEGHSTILIDCPASVIVIKVVKMKESILTPN